MEAAKIIYDFLHKCTDTDGRMFFTVTKEGKEIQKRRYYFSETFAAIGCAEYYKATGEKQALRSAENYFNIAYDCFMGIRKTEPKFYPNNQCLKALSPVMIMLSTAQSMRSLGVNRERYSRIARDCLNEILNGGFLQEKAVLENVALDGSFEDTPTGRIVNPGHSMETAWFIMLEGILTNKRDVIEKGKEIIDIKIVTEKIRNFLFNKGNDNKGWH